MDLLGNPFNVGLIRANITFKKGTHTHQGQRNLVGNKRLMRAERALHESTKIGYLEQFETCGERHSLAVIQKAKETLTEKPMTKEEFINDLQFALNYEAGSDAKYIQSLELLPFSLSLYDESMLLHIGTLYYNSTWEEPLILAGDVSGEILFYPSKALNRRQNVQGLLTFSMTAPHAVSCLDVMLEQARTIDLSPALLKWRNSLFNVSNNVGICEIFIFDFSWPIIISILEIILQKDINSYLAQKFKEIMSGHQLMKGDTVILVDLLQLVKIFLKAARKKTSKKIADRFVLIFLKFLTCRTIDQVKQLWTLVSTYFGLEYISVEAKEKIQELCEDIDNKNIIDYAGNEEIYDEVYEDEYNDNEGQKGIRNRSPFKSYFQKITDDVYSQEDEVQSHEINTYFCKELVSYFLGQYLPLLPLMSLVSCPKSYVGDYPTSSSVENHFKNIKETLFKNIPLKRRYPAEFVKMLQNYNKLQRESVLHEGIYLQNRIYYLFHEVY